MDHIFPYQFTGEGAKQQIVILYWNTFTTVHGVSHDISAVENLV